ncbi:hypothetical protein Ade02nite_78090 [Paractinoplanes deccanensis]|uniref:Uncharacterized protein n=1 Tax=Paractinoplanes deccanensis TaxID=113561 RepID=A0ABQ3YGP6_9ACTN|nr:hypothetical protein [Actinoplanes deccanensis]GID79168.1 hypothetical protein Ade02nite_78090 [Actinoplanes deccanensis]
MEPTSSPDNARSNRGLARFWPVHREGEDEATAPDSTEMPATRSGETASETEMVALGSRRATEPEPSAPSEDEPAETPAAAGDTPAAASRPEPATLSAPLSPAAPAGQHGLPDRDPDHSGPGEDEKDDAPAVESARATPWDPDAGTFGGFGLGGRNGRFLFGGRNPLEPRPAGLNGHSHGGTNGSASTVEGPGQAAEHDQNGHDENGHDENGRDDMNGRIPTTGDNGSAPVSGPSGATGWASVPTSKHPTVSPTSGAPTSGAPVSSAPVSPASPGSPAPGLGFGGSYGEPPSYTPALPDPASGPVSGVPAPRAASASIPVPAAPLSKPPATSSTTFGGDGGRSATTFGGDTGSKSPATFGGDGGSPSPATFSDLGTKPPATFGDLGTKPPAAFDGDGGDKPAAGFRAVPAADEDAPPLPRRSASLEDAEPARRGRRAAPEEPEERHEEAPLRPGDVAEGHIAFWDEDAVRHFRAAWHEVKAEFVDDPETALTRAHDLLTDAVNELTEALLAERDELDPLRGNKTPDTESMRMAMRGYREFLDRILAL